MILEVIFYYMCSRWVSRGGIWLHWAELEGVCGDWSQVGGAHMMAFGDWVVERGMTVLWANGRSWSGQGGSSDGCQGIVQWVVGGEIDGGEWCGIGWTMCKLLRNVCVWLVSALQVLLTFEGGQSAGQCKEGEGGVEVGAEGAVQAIGGNDGG